jgi:hypothetical protein
MEFRSGHRVAQVSAARGCCRSAALRDGLAGEGRAPTHLRIRRRFVRRASSMATWSTWYRLGMASSTVRLHVCLPGSRSPAAHNTIQMPRAT